MMDFRINRRLLPLKVSFFAMLAAGTWLVPFMILILRQLGLTASECSVILGSLPLSNGIIRLVAGAIADKLQRHKEMMLVNGVVSTILIECMLLVPPVPTKIIQNKLVANLTNMCESNINKTMRCNIQVVNTNWYDSTVSSCHQSAFNATSNTSSCTEILAGGPENDLGNLACILFCNGSQFEDSLIVKDTPFGKTFWLLFGIYFIGYNMYFVSWPILYGMTYALLGKERNKFGEQRMWATVGALAMSVASAFALNKYGSQQGDMDFTACFVGFGIFANICGISAMFLSLPHIPRNPSMFKDVLVLVKQPRIFALFLVLFMMGFLFGAADTFLFWFLRSLGATSWTLGACLFVASIAEIPSLYFSGRIITRIGYEKCVYIALFVYFIRYLGTSLIPGPWWELPFTSLKSIVFSVGFTAITVYTSSITPPAMHATLQAIVTAIHFGFGRGIGIFTFGPVMEALGARWAFRICSCLALVTCLLFAVAQRILPPVREDLFDQNEKIDTEKQLKNGTTFDSELNTKEDQFCDAGENTNMTTA